MSTSPPAQRPPAPAPQPQGLGLGLDVGGTQTRWALAVPAPVAAPQVLAEGELPGGWSGLMLASDDGRAAVAQVLTQVMTQVAAACAPHGRVQAVLAGLTGFDPAQLPVLQSLLGGAFGLPAADTAAMSDIELACHAAFAPGAGFVLYAGTGSVAAFLDAQGQLQRVGGRGAVIDDAGGGHWIATQALRLVWRAEDEAPGAWQQSLLARRLFELVGGPDWAHTRQWVYGASRGELGTLALAVAAAAEQGDLQAEQVLDEAGRELARLALALAHRHGPRPVVLAGRVFELHPRLVAALQAALLAAAAQASAAQPGHDAAWATLADAQPRALRPHQAAAQLAAATLAAASPALASAPVSPPPPAPPVPPAPGAFSR